MLSFTSILPMPDESLDFLTYSYSANLYRCVTSSNGILGEKVKGISETKNYLIVGKDKLGLKLKINVSTFNFWVSYVPESVASYQ